MKKIYKIINILIICPLVISDIYGLNKKEKFILISSSTAAVCGTISLKKLLSNKKKAKILFNNEEFKKLNKDEKISNKNFLFKSFNKEFEKFNEREQNWIKFLLGEKISDKSFLFKSCEEFRNSNNSDLERKHDFIQVVFPNLEKSGYANQDLYLNRKLQEWKNLLSNKDLRLKIQKNMKLNLIRILEFFGFEIERNINYEITKIKANPDSIIFKPGNHNGRRFTRVLKCLKLFDLNKEYYLIIDSIIENNQIINIINKNSVLKTSYKFWINSGNTTCFF